MTIKRGLIKQKSPCRFFDQMPLRRLEKYKLQFD